MLYGIAPYWIIIGMFAIPVMLGFWFVSFNGKLYTGQKMWQTTAIVAFAVAVTIYTVYHHLPPGELLPHGLTSIGWSAMGLFLMGGVLGFSPLLEWWMALRAEMFERGITSRAEVREAIQKAQAETGMMAVLRSRHAARASARAAART